MDPTDRFGVRSISTPLKITLKVLQVSNLWNSKTEMVINSKISSFTNTFISVDSKTNYGISSLVLMINIPWPVCAINANYFAQLLRIRLLLFSEVTIWIPWWPSSLYFLTLRSRCLWDSYWVLQMSSFHYFLVAKRLNFEIFVNQLYCWPKIPD